MAELTGQTFAGYEIVAKLGEGGMGAVYKAKQPILNRFVALKTMAAHLGGDKDFVARFQREAASAATLSHPNVVGVHTAGEVDGTHYIVMEFVEGESVRKRLDREGKIPSAEALAITIYVAQALQYAWNKARLIHRDIKPDNIFLSNAGEVKVGDLGLAKSLATEGTEMTATGMAMGSPHYISPEQATGLKDIDFRTDIYSLGCTLYHMLTGQTPYKGDSSMIVMMKHVNDPPPAIFKAWPQCPMPLGMLVGRMLAKDRNARPKSYEQLVADLFAMSEKLAVVSSQPSAVSAQPAVAEKAAAPALAPATSPDAPTVALQPSAKPKSPVAIYAAAGVAAVLALGGLFLWSPWKAGEAVSGKGQAEPGSESRLQAESASTPPAKAGTPNADAALKQLGSVFTNAVDAEMVYIPPGEFMLGSTKEEQAWAVANGYQAKNAKNEGETPQKAKIKDGFWIGRTEVTVGQWKQFVAATGYRTVAEKKGFVDAAPRKGQRVGRVDGASWKDPQFGVPPQDQHPVSCVSWLDAVAFCDWLTEHERQSGHLPAGFVVRLPTEAEWEYACRAGTQTKFWWGDSKEEGEGRLNKAGKEDGFEFAAPVDSFGPQGRNRFGLADMLGNIYEWCLDNFDAAHAHEACYQGDSTCRVVRGGSFSLLPVVCRCASRASHVPDFSYYSFGFRVVAGMAPARALGDVAAIPRIGDDAAWPNAINLLPLIDPQKDAVAGQWSVANGELTVSQGTTYARIEMPYLPPSDYDFRIEFTRETSIGAIWQMLACKDHSFNWCIAGGTGKTVGRWFGFEAESRTMETSPASVLMEQNIENGRRYVSELKVRTEGVQSFFNGRLVTEWKNNYGGTRISRVLALHDERLLGVGAHFSKTTFHRIEVREVAGKGTFTRGAPSGASATPILQHSNPPAPWFSAFCVEVAALPAEQQVARVLAKLKDHNPGFDGLEKHKIEGHDVVDLEISAINVTDISPVSALKKLRRFVCIASTDGKKRSKLSDLTPLRGLLLVELRVPGCDVSDLSVVRGMPLDHLGILHTLITDLSPLQDAPLTVINCDQAMAMTPANLAVLRSIKSLNSVSGSAQKFWRQVNAGEAPKAK